ncbi:MAG: uroporphyrinogen decarboxylase family protein [Desulfobacterium sp.]|nr:uroporphyrinogen decarboxylase family protein [Desulfobacterium sp.]
MNSRERVLMALNHEQPDRVPMDLGGRQTTLMIPAYERLKEYLGFSDIPTKIMSHIWQTAYIDEAILKHFSIDCRHIRPKNKAFAPERPFEPEEIFTDPWGVKRRISGGYANQCGHPLQKATTIEEIENYPWPDPEEEFDYTGLREHAQKLYNEGEYALVGCIGSPCSTYEQAYYMRGLSELLMDLVMHKDMAHAIMKKVLAHRKRSVELYLNEVGEFIDVIQLADDLGTQTNSIMSPATYREMVKPYQAELISHIKTMTKARIYHHSCGSVVKLLDDMIDIGIEILNPVQATAVGMETDQLKKRFGKKLTFWGAIDTFQVLPNGSVSDVKKEVEKRITDLGPGGGYVLGSVHNMQFDVPPENVEAMFKTALEFRL